MNKLLLTVLLASFSIFFSLTSFAQASKGTPVEWTPVIDVKQVPKKIQNSFAETTEMAGMTLLDKPKWIRQNGLYTVSFRSHMEYGSGNAVLRFKPYGGLVLFMFEPDEPLPSEW